MFEYVSTLSSLITFAITLMVIYGIVSLFSYPANLPPMPCLPLPVFGHALFIKPSVLQALTRWRKQHSGKFPRSMERTAQHLAVNFEIFRHGQKPYGTHDFLRGQAKEVRVLTNSAVSNVICAILLGERFDYNDLFFVRFIRQNDDLIRLVGTSSILHSFPWLRFLPGDLFDAKRLCRVYRELDETFSDRFIKKFKDSINDGCTDNYITAYLREIKRRENTDTYINEMNLKRNVNDLFLAGSETTSSTILWAFLFAIKCPECQEKVYKEIKEIAGTERVPTIHDRSNMNYLNAFIMESQRLGSIVPLGLNHRCSKTTQVGGYTIPEGATVIPFLDTILKDPNTWHEPKEFQPERFLDKHNNLITPRQFVPFSLGRRICLGESLARMELFLFLSALFQRFEILPETPNCPPPMEGNFGITMAPKHFPVRFKQRQ